jgi:RimJ/RimL family protein N-acetyltransferase
MAVTLETERLLIRPWRDADLEPWSAMGADPHVMEFFPSAYDRERAAAVAAHLRESLERDGFGWWIVEIKHRGACRGGMASRARALGPRLRDRSPRAVIDFAFEELHHAEVVAFTAAMNVRSQRVMQRLGMTHDPRDDFMLPLLEPGHRLRPHVLYRASRAGGPSPRS